MSCFLNDIDFIFKISKKLQYAYPGFVGAHLSQRFRSISVGPKSNIISCAVCGVMVVSNKSENHDKNDFSNSWRVKVKSYYAPMKQNNFMEILDYSSLKI